jgi:hypothetical protein
MRIMKKVCEDYLTKMLLQFLYFYILEQEWFMVEKYEECMRRLPD